MLLQTGYVYSKVAPQLVLGLSEQKLTARLSHPVYGRSESTSVAGLVVCVQKKLAGAGSANQLWAFTADGNITCQVRYVLLAARHFIIIIIIIITNNL